MISQKQKRITNNLKTLTLYYLLFLVLRGIKLVKKYKSWIDRIHVFYKKQ